MTHWVSIFNFFICFCQIFGSWFQNKRAQRPNFSWPVDIFLMYTWKLDFFKTVIFFQWSVACCFTTKCTVIYINNYLEYDPEVSMWSINSSIIFFCKFMYFSFDCTCYKSYSIYTPLTKWYEGSISFRVCGCFYISEHLWINL